MPRKKHLLEIDTNPDAAGSKPPLMPLSPLSPASAKYYPMDDNLERMDRYIGAAGLYRNPLSPSSVHSNSIRIGHHRYSSQGSFSQSQDFQKMLEEDTPHHPFVLDKKNGEEDDDEVYLVQQKHGYMSILFSLAQTIILIIMMSKCGVAPLKINPMIGPYPDALSEWGAKNAVDILDDGQWWRLISPIMLHAGVIHLLCNVSVQLDMGVFFEREWGSIKWLTIYLSSAVGSTILSVIFKPDSISVGSSGAVMGLFGAKLSEVICRCCESDRTRQERIGHQVRKEQCAGVVCSVLIVVAFSVIPYVDWAAHLGGLLAGICVGMVVFSLDISRQVWKLFWLLMGIAMTVVYFVVSLQYMYSGNIQPSAELRDVCGYYQQYFQDYQCHCMIHQQQN